MRSNNQPVVFQNLLLLQQKQTQCSLCVFSWWMPSLLDLLPQKFGAEIFQRYEFAWLLLKLTVLTNIHHCFASLPILQSAYLQILPDCVPYYNLVIEDVLDVVNNCLDARRVLDMSISYSWDVADVIRDLFIWVDIGVKPALSLFINEGNSGQQFLLITLDELAINCNKLIVSFSFYFLLYLILWHRSTGDELLPVAQAICVDFVLWLFWLDINRFALTF